MHLSKTLPADVYRYMFIDIQACGVAVVKASVVVYYADTVLAAARFSRRSGDGSEPAAVTKLVDGLGRLLVRGVEDDELLVVGR